jgi:hypothetical protein
MGPGPQLETRTDGHDTSTPAGTGSNGYTVARNLHPTLVVTSSLRSLGRETRKHPPAQLRKLAESLERFGFVLPILIDDQRRVVAGWGLVLAARKLGLPEVPAVTIADLGEADLRLLRLALNRIGEESSWDPDALKPCGSARSCRGWRILTRAAASTTRFSSPPPRRTAMAL